MTRKPFKTLVAAGLSLVAAACARMAEPARAPAPAAARLAYSDDGANAKLTYALTTAADAGFLLECRHGAGAVHVTQLGVVHPPKRLRLQSGAAYAEVPAVSQAFEGYALLVGEAPAASAPLAAFRRTGALRVGQGDVAYDVAASPGERGGVDRFFAACG